MTESSDMTMMNSLRRQIEADIGAVEISQDAAMRLAAEIAENDDPRSIMDAFGRIVAGKVTVEDVPVTIAHAIWAQGAYH